MSTLHVIINKTEDGDKMGIYMTDISSIDPSHTNVFIEKKIREYLDKYETSTGDMIPLEVFISYDNHRVKFKNTGFIFLISKEGDASTDFVTSYILEWKEV